MKPRPRGAWERVRLALRFGAAASTVAAAMYPARASVLVAVATGLGALSLDLPRDDWDDRPPAPAGQ